MTIVKRDGKFRVISHTGKNLGESETKEAAVRRLRQVEMFRRLKKCFRYPEKLEKEEDLKKEDSGISVATSA